MASLQAALKTAVQVVFQLEDTELVAEPLPDSVDRRRLLFFEASEGGAGVLRRLLAEPEALARVARKALEICHFEDANSSVQACEAACYDCLRSYTNQPDHRLLDRRLIEDQLRALAASSVMVGSGMLPRGEQRRRLEASLASDLERRWLSAVADRGHRLPSTPQHRFGDLLIEADFVYASDYCAILRS